MNVRIKIFAAVVFLFVLTLPKDFVEAKEIGGPGTCGYKLYAYGDWQIECGVNYETVMWVRMMWPDAQMWWCCDSCEDSSYCGNEF